ncbi:hypothetical protein HUU05_08355 [candidate division KSB1 bacterium]|nr:hypothetical protein [candidate division KSB1 bacterium]
METTTVQLKIPTAHYKLVEEIASQSRKMIDEVLASFVSERLEREARLQEARQLMRQLGKGLGASKPPHDAADNHDVYLYGKPRP